MPSFFAAAVTLSFVAASAWAINFFRLVQIERPRFFLGLREPRLRGATLPWQLSVRLFALLNIAMADAAICAWDAKYEFHFWRPVTVIDYVEPELHWMSFIVTPPFPDYVSGHSTFSASAATVLALFYGTEDLPFTIGSDFLPGVYRSFPTCLAAAAEAAVSRLYGGIHFRSANEDGLQAGISIGEWTGARYLQPKGNRSR